MYEIERLEAMLKFYKDQHAWGDIDKGTYVLLTTGLMDRLERNYKALRAQPGAIERN